MNSADIKKIITDARAYISSAMSINEINSARHAYLGRKAGKLTVLLRSLKDLSPDEKRSIGPALQKAKEEIIDAIDIRLQEIHNAESGMRILDVTAPGTELPHGHLHLITQSIEEIDRIFRHIGFLRREYPEVETDFYAFESLNMPPDHPARDDWETFFIKKPRDEHDIGIVLTPHTSSGQVREMERGKLPIRMINISKCYRRQSDISHTPMFHQFEGLLIDKNVTIANLKGVLDYFFRSFFGAETKFRFRPYNFRFTEPSFEIDISCVLCKGAGCRYCKEGWSELGGAGMVHPNVLRAGGIDPERYGGFAFGWGIERVTMMRDGLNISDLRILYKNDIRFLSQF